MCTDACVDAYLSTKRLRFLIDTGADVTTLCLRDAYQLLGKDAFWDVQQNAETVEAWTMGDVLDQFHPLDCVMVFTRTDGLTDKMSVRVDIPHTTEDYFQITVSNGREVSKLGRNVLWNYKLTIDYPKNEVWLSENGYNI